MGGTERALLLGAVAREWYYGLFPTTTATVHRLTTPFLWPQVSAASYQILSQSKLIFTGFFMVTLLGKRLSAKQLLALVVLLAGSVCTQLSEISRSSLVGGGNPLYGGFLTVLGAALSALPNVYYEKILKVRIPLRRFFVTHSPNFTEAEAWRGGAQH